MLVRMVTRFCNFSTIRVPLFLSSSFLFPRCNSYWSNLSPTTVISSSICHCFSSVSQSLSRHTGSTSRYATDATLDSVVEIFAFCSTPSLVEPWQKWEASTSSCGSGFVISGRRILTNAHVVDDAYDAYVQVRKHGSTTKYEAIVDTVGFECDLAILVVDNEEFWEDVNPLELGDIPSIYDDVSVLGYPRGGDTICVTKGIVSRVESGEYEHSSIELLKIQTDAIIDYGNSGGPVVCGNKVVGIVFQGFPCYEKTDYMIPTPVIKHFLSCVEKSGYYIGPGSLDISCQTMENAELRKHFKMKHELTGVLINEINTVSAAHKILEKNDVILSIDGVPIGNDAKVSFRGKERVSFNHLISMKKPGETSLFKVLRDGREYTFRISYRPEQLLVPVRQLNSVYYIFAGFIFVPLSMAYINTHYCTICKSCALKRMTEPGGQIVIISQVLFDAINVKYTSFRDLQVKKVNGVELKNMEQLRRLVKNCRDEYLKLDLEEGKVIVLNYKSAKEETSLILKRYGIGSATSVH